MPGRIFLNRIQDLLEQLHHVASLYRPDPTCSEYGQQKMLGWVFDRLRRTLEDIESIFLDPKDREALAAVDDLTYHGMELLNLASNQVDGVSLSNPCAHLPARWVQIQDSLAILQNRVDPPSSESLAPVTPPEQTEADPVCTVSDNTTASCPFIN